MNKVKRIINQFLTQKVVKECFHPTQRLLAPFSLQSMSKLLYPSKDNLFSILQSTQNETTGFKRQYIDNTAHFNRNVRMTASISTITQSNDPHSFKHHSQRAMSFFPCFMESSSAHYHSVSESEGSSRTCKGGLGIQWRYTLTVEMAARAVKYPN